MAKKPAVIKYRGGTYKAVKAGGLGSTTQRFPLIGKEYTDDVRTLSYDGGAYVLELALKWKSTPGAQAELPPIPLEERDAALVFHALLRDGGKVSSEYQEQEAAGSLPEPIRALQNPDQPALMAASTEKSAALLRWRGEEMLWEPPDEEVALVRFQLCSPEQGFSLNGLDYPGVPRDLLEEFSQDLHIALTQMFPGATIDTQIVDSTTGHCGYPQVFNKGGGPVKGHDRKIGSLAHSIWNRLWTAFQQQ